MLLIKYPTSWSFILLLFCHLTTANEYWPRGSYGLPKPKAGCPGANGFQWLEGWLLQDTVTESGHARSSNLHLQADLRRSKNIKRYFCMKTSDSSIIDGGNWPKGKYCIYRKGGTCPSRMSGGHVKWDDEDSWNVSGQTPDGVYNRKSRIYYCCHTKGLKTNPISLPTSRPFFLMAYGSSTCQQVKWALASREWLTFHTEEDSDVSGKYPYGASRDNPRIHYCYYISCNYTYNTTMGSFQSPNHPNHYPDGQWCSWRIHVANNQIIKLQFTSFNLERMINTDQVLVYDGANETSVQLGTFYGGNLPPMEGVQSSSNSMLVIFKSDGTSQYTGFKANYSTVPKPTTQLPREYTPTPTPTPTPTSLLTSHIQPSVRSTLGEVVTVTVTATTTLSSQLHALSKSYSYDISTTGKTEQTPTEKVTEPSENSSEVYKGKLRSKNDASRTAISVGLPLMFAVIIVAFVVAAIWKKRKRAQKKFAEQTTNLTDTSASRPKSIINPVYATIEEVKLRQSCSSGKNVQCSDNPLYDGGSRDKVQVNPTYERSLINNHYEDIPVV